MFKFHSALSIKSADILILLMYINHAAWQMVEASSNLVSHPVLKFLGKREVMRYRVRGNTDPKNMWVF